ncbi:MAG: hypothetical protein H6742_01075 [Alphaproteobacteria bacterium]|nr:hypothetical protein [Alphaproteobacteria bacterium]
MAPRLVLRIERDGQLLGSWSIGDAPLDMSVVDLTDGRTLARFQACAEQLHLHEPIGGPVDELPVPLHRLEDDDFTMPMPEPTATGGELPPLTTEEVPLPTPRTARPRPVNLAQLANIDESMLDDIGSLTAELVPMEEELFPVGDTDLGPRAEELEALTTGSLAPLDGSPVDEAPVDEVPVAEVEERDTQPDVERLVSEEATAPGGAARRLAQRNLAQLAAADDEPSLTARIARPDREDTGKRASTDPEQTARSLVRPPVTRARRPQPAEVWAQKRGEWKSIGQLTPGQRVRTLGGWVRLAPDGRLVVSSGHDLSGTATLIDGRMLEIDRGQEFIALPPGSSVMLAHGDRGIYVRSEPLPSAQNAS